MDERGVSVLYECANCGFLTRDSNDWGGWMGPCPKCGASHESKLIYDWDEPLSSSRNKLELVAATAIGTFLALALLVRLVQCGR
jgi:DNA-directed RNA polymerase subunit RPC12/RpoP